MNDTINSHHQRAVSDLVNHLFPTPELSLAQEPDTPFDLTEQSLLQASESGNFGFLLAPVLHRESLQNPVFFEASAVLNRSFPIHSDLHLMKNKILGKPLGLLLDRLTLQHAIEALEENPDLTITIKMSIAGLSQKDCIDIFERAAGLQTQVCKRLLIELSEKTVMRMPEITQHFMQTLAPSWVRFILGDFGSGGCALRSLKSLPFDYIKIDESLTCNPWFYPNGEKLLSAIAAMCVELGFQSYAGGISNGKSFLSAHQATIDYLTGPFLNSPDPNAWNRMLS